MSTGFFIGQPVAYKSSSEDEKEISALLEIFKYNDEHYHNLSLAEEASITGEAYEVLYTDADAQIRFNSIQHYFDNFFIVEYANNKNYRGNFFA